MTVYLNKKKEGASSQKTTIYIVEATLFKTALNRQEQEVT